MIDSMLFVADLPIDTYTVGQKITFTQIDGPAVVRDGLGTATLKSINTGSLFWASESKPNVRYSVKNSNWNDAVLNGPSALSDVNGLDEKSTGYQSGNDCVLQVNSAFEVEADVVQGFTTTGANTLFILIDIEYSGLSGVQDPRGEVGTPASIVYNLDNLPTTAAGTFSAGTWTVVSFDKYKAGYRYLLQKMSIQSSATGSTARGFIKIFGGATMGGLARIIPVNSLASAVGKEITYTSPEVKGPLSIGAMLEITTGGTSDIGILCDYVKRG